MNPPNRKQSRRLVRNTVLLAKSNAPRIRARIVGISLYLISGVIVVVLLNNRLSKTSIRVEALSDVIQATLMSPPGVESPNYFFDWHYTPVATGADLDYQSDSIGLSLFNLPPETSIQFGLSERTFPERSIDFVAWGEGIPQRLYNDLYIRSGTKTWLFRGRAPQRSGAAELTRGDPIPAHSVLHFSTLGGALGLNYFVANPSKIDSTATREMHEEARITSGRIRFTKLRDKEVRLERGDLFWMQGDTGQITLLAASDSGAQLIYDANIHGATLQRGGITHELMPTWYEWIMSRPIIAVGLGLTLTLGAALVGFLGWWKNPDPK